jgi:hypothetical protein
VCKKANFELNKNAGRMNKSLICEIAIAHNYGRPPKKKLFKKIKWRKKESRGGATKHKIHDFFQYFSAIFIISTRFFFVFWPIGKKIVH